MNDVILSDYQAALRAAHEQVQLLERAYEERAEGSGARLAELRDYREALLSELRREDLLPTEPDPEHESLKRLISGIRDALAEEKDSLIAAAEADLDDLGRQLEQCDVALPPAIRDGIARTRRIAGRQSQA